MTGAPRLLIFGAGGFVGGWLARAAASGFSIAAAGRVEITDAAAVSEAVARARPDVVALLAAMSDIDRCEREPDRAEAVNVRGAEHVARACRAAGARLIFTSSGAVFDGSQAEYTEDDPPCPVNFYGKSKARGEAAVLAILPDAVIVRLTLVLGVGLAPGTNSLVSKLLLSWDRHQPVALPVAEYRNALDAESVAAHLVELSKRPEARGIYHLGSTTVLSRFEIGRALAARFGYPEELVRAQSAPPPGRAPRGVYEFLRPERIAAYSPAPLPSCEIAIERCAHAIAQGHS